MLMSFAATQAPDSATEARTRTSSARCRLRSLNDRKNGKSARISPVVQVATMSDCPADTCVADRTARALPTPNADRAGAPSWTVRCPPARATSYQLHASFIPRRASRASSALPTIVSMIDKGMAPIAARSLTFARTAAMPAPYGSAATKAGSSASPQAMTWSPVRGPSTCGPIGTTEPSSPGPCTQLPPPRTSLTRPISPFARRVG